MLFTDDANHDFEFAVFIHDEIVKASGGLGGVHDENLLRSALVRPLQTAHGTEQFTTVFQKAAALLYSIANNHGFNDGNKRTAMALAGYLLATYGYIVNFTNDEYEEVMLWVVKTKPRVKEIADWLEGHCADTSKESKT